MGDSARYAERVTVPCVVGLSVEAGCRIAGEAGVVLAATDPDGPPLGALTWPDPYVITTQQPVVGSQLYRWDSVIVTFERDKGGSAGDREPRRPLPDPKAAGASVRPEE